MDGPREMTMQDINDAATNAGRAFSPEVCTREAWRVANAEWHRLCALHGVYGGGPWGNVYVAPRDWPVEPARFV